MAVTDGREGQSVGWQREGPTFQQCESSAVSWLSGPVCNSVGGAGEAIQCKTQVEAPWSPWYPANGNGTLPLLHLRQRRMGPGPAEANGPATLGRERKATDTRVHT